MGITVSSSQNEEKIYDEFRGLWVTATPEERIRQSLLKKMVGALSYPKGLLTVEASLSRVCNKQIISVSKIPTRRLDIICFAKRKNSLVPLLIIECKEDASLVEAAWQQVLGYNHFVQAPFLAVAYPDGERFGYPTEKGFVFLSRLPSYTDLIRAVNYA